MNANSQSQELVRRSKILVYFLAAPPEEDECQAIKKHLTPAIRSSKIPVEILSDFEIPAGEDKAKYKQKLFEADIVLSLISADYISDDETYERTQKVIQRYNNGETILVPILVRNCLWKHTPFVKLSLLPKNLQPLNNKQYWNSEDDALMAVVEDIYEAINAVGEEEEIEVETPATIENVSEQKAEPEISAVEQEVIAVQPEEPMVKEDAVVTVEEKVEEIKPESRAEITATPPLESPVIESPEQKKIPPKAKKAVIPLEVDWRKQHYKQVLWKRALAFLLDHLIIIPIIFIGMFLFLVILFIIKNDPNSADLKDYENTIVTIFTISLYFIVNAKMESSKWRGTFGKRILKLQITDRSGEPISFFRALWRNIARVIVGYSYIFIIPLIIQIITFKKSKKLFHDQLSSTVIGERLS